MKFISTLISIIGLQFMTSTSFGQVSKLKYQLEYNTLDSTYSVYIKIIEGSSKTAPHRAQFNSQISIVLPTEISIKINKNFMPLQGNNTPNTGTAPLQWTLSSTVKSPAVLPKHDFHSITPTLSPTSFYNILNPDDEIKLFSFRVSPMPSEPSAVRFFDNEKDPKSYQAGMGGGDFTNMFTIGGIVNDYSGNLPLRIINTVATKDVTDEEIKVYPNPVMNQFSIETKYGIDYYRLIDSKGRTILSGNTFNVDCSSIPIGLYLLEVINSKGKSVKKIVKQQ